MADPAEPLSGAGSFGQDDIVEGEARPRRIGGGEPEAAVTGRRNTRLTRVSPMAGRLSPLSTMENLDITRHLNIASGGNFFPSGDVADTVLSTA